MWGARPPWARPPWEPLLFRTDVTGQHHDIGICAFVFERAEFDVEVAKDVNLHFQWWLTAVSRAAGRPAL